MNFYLIGIVVIVFKHCGLSFYYNAMVKWLVVMAHKIGTRITIEPKWQVSGKVEPLVMF